MGETPVSTTDSGSCIGHRPIVAAHGGMAPTLACHLRGLLTGAELHNASTTSCTSNALFRRSRFT